MQVLGTDRPLLLWGAERAFQIQLLAGLGRLGMDVFSLTDGEEGKKLVDQIHPKNAAELQIPKDFEGILLWAPSTELFSNSALSPESLGEIQNVDQQTQNNPRIEKCILLLPQEAFKQKLSLSEENKSKFHFIYFPTLLGFGDKNIFDQLLVLFLDTTVKHTGLNGSFLSIFDAVSFVLSFLKLKDKAESIWIEGTPISETAIRMGFNEISNDSTLRNFLGLLQYSYKKIIKKLPALSYKETQRPTEVPLALEIFPTVLTPWERFFRDSYRIYTQTQDSQLLLHFRPTKTP
ncbi:MAG: hypothetical protein R3A80_05535 [Bdellovibrionota bacterium]